MFFSRYDESLATNESLYPICEYVYEILEHVSARMRDRIIETNDTQRKTFKRYLLEVSNLVNEFSGKSLAESETHKLNDVHQSLLRVSNSIGTVTAKGN